MIKHAKISALPHLLLVLETRYLFVHQTCVSIIALKQYIYTPHYISAQFSQFAANIFISNGYLRASQEDTKTLVTCLIW